MWNDFKLKFRYYLFPQIKFALLLTICGPIVGIHVSPYVSELIYSITHWRTFHNNSYFLASLILVMVWTVYYVFYGSRSLRIIYFSDFGRKVAYAGLPGIAGVVGGVMLIIHSEKMKEHCYEIQDVSEIRNISDSTEIYTIRNYEVFYEQYFKSVDVREVNRGSNKNRWYGTDVDSYFICPLIIPYLPVKEVRNQKVWVGFNFKKKYGEVHEEESDDIKETKQDHINTFYEQRPVAFFKETRQDEYFDILYAEMSDSLWTESRIILEGEFEPYEPYNGYQLVLITFYIYLGSFLFMGIMVFFADVNEEERRKHNSN